MASLFSQVSAADADRLGQERPDFPATGAEPYKRDLKNIEFHLLDTGHFALEEDGDIIADYIRGFLVKNKIN